MLGGGRNGHLCLRLLAPFADFVPETTILTDSLVWPSARPSRLPRLLLPVTKEAGGWSE
jgi:hypothetical protein